jgi:hypothetical protein
MSNYYSKFVTSLDLGTEQRVNIANDVVAVEMWRTESEGVDFSFHSYPDPNNPEKLIISTDDTADYSDLGRCLLCIGRNIGLSGRKAVSVAHYSDSEDEGDYGGALVIVDFDEKTYSVFDTITAEDAINTHPSEKFELKFSKYDKDGNDLL